MKLQADMFLLMAYLLAAAVGIGAALYIFQQLFSGLDANSQFAACTNCVEALTKGAQAQNNVADALVVVFILAGFGSIILSAFIDSSPIFLIFVVITIPVELLVSFVFHDVWFAIADSSFIGAALTGVPGLATLFEFLPVIVLVLSVLVAIVTFTRG